jgi:hypothetical protein
VSATLHGTLLDDGRDPAGCQCWFEWGPTVAYGTVSVMFVRFTGGTFQEAVAPPPGTYHFRANAQNAAGVVNGADETFVIPVVVVALSETFLNRSYPLGRYQI